jgi:putative MATE family efflux protein
VTTTTSSAAASADAGNDATSAAEATANITEGPLLPAILRLATPMVLEMALESTFAIADIFFVGRIGTAAVATVGVTESLMTLVYTVAMGLSIGAAAVVARRIGERDPEAAAVAAGQALALGAAIGLAVGVVGALAGPQLLALMGASQDVVTSGAGYARTLLGGNVLVLTLFLVNSIHRGAGNGRIPMQGLVVANILNLSLCPLLVFGLAGLPALGVTGAAVATTVARGAAMLYATVRLALPGAALRLARRHLALVPAVMKQVGLLSLTGSLQVFIGMASWIGLVRTMAPFGDAALAGYTIGIRVVIFALMPAVGLANAAATMVGQSLGAKRPERAEKAVWHASTYNVVFLTLVGAALYFAARSIVGWFTEDAATAAFGVDCLRLVALGFPLYAYAIVLGSAFNGAGDAWTPTWINLGAFWVFEIPLAIGLAHGAALGPHGVFISIVAAFSLLAVVSALLFRRGGWKTRVV